MADQKAAPEVMIFHLGGPELGELVDEMYGPLFDDIRSRYGTVIATSAAVANEYLNTRPTIRAVFVVDGVLIASSRYENFQKRLARYIQEDGGLVLFGGLLDGFRDEFEESEEIFAHFRQPWRIRLGLDEATVKLNRAVAGALFGPSIVKTLPESSRRISCSQLIGVQEWARVYVDEHDNRLCPAALVRYGKGFLGYFGGTYLEGPSAAFTKAVLGPAIAESQDRSWQTWTLPISRERCTICNGTRNLIGCSCCKTTRYCSMMCKSAAGFDIQMAQDGNSEEGSSVDTTAWKEKFKDRDFEIRGPESDDSKDDSYEDGECEEAEPEKSDPEDGESEGAESGEGDPVDGETEDSNTEDETSVARVVA